MTRWVLALLAAMVLAFAAYAVTEGWIVFRNPIHTSPLDFSYLNKRLSGGVILGPPVTLYFLIAYGAANWIARRRCATLDLSRAVRWGALVGGLPAIPLLLVGERVMPLIAVALGAGVFGLLRLIPAADDPNSGETAARRHLAASIIVGAPVGVAFTAWVFHVDLWRGLSGEYYDVARGAIDFGAIAFSALEWFVAATLAVAGLYWLCFLAWRTAVNLVAFLSAKA